MGADEERLNEFLSAFGRDTWDFFGNLTLSYTRAGMQPPWAIIFLNRDHRIFGHLSSVRQNRSDFVFSSLSLRGENYSVEESGPPPVSFIAVRSKDVLEKLAPSSPIFSSAWQLLANGSKLNHWFCIADPLPEEWLSEVERDG